ncbi:MAG: ribonuclease [Butyrivibrio sp.]|nr:ribonuclease [Butyrivibrio sp.]
MKNKLKRLNFILAILLVLVLGAGCGRQKVVELPTAAAATESTVAASVETSIAVATTESTAEASVEAPVTVATESTSETTASESSDGAAQQDLSSAGDIDSQSDSQQTDGAAQQTESVSTSLDEDGVYTSKDDLAAYIHEFGRLPQNFITKKEAKALGWPGGSLEEYAPGKCIGGDRFGNYEGLLPEENGRKYYECDVDTLGKKSRGAKRIIYSNDGLIFYTKDHYESFEQLY